MNNVLDAVNDFLVNVMLIPQGSIYYGWQNRSSLPADSSYIVLTLQSQIRHGTNVHTWDDTTPPYGIDDTVSMLTEYEVQVDVCGTNEAVVSNLTSQLCMLGRDAVAVDFWRDYGLRALYADNPRPMPFVNEFEQWETRYSVTLHLSGWTTFDIHHDAFEAVTVYTENVDVHHPITD